jgi:hypothetical protein
VEGRLQSLPEMDLGEVMVSEILVEFGLLHVSHEAVDCWLVVKQMNDCGHCTESIYSKAGPLVCL